MSRWPRGPSVAGVAAAPWRAVAREAATDGGVDAGVASALISRNRLGEVAAAVVHTLVRVKLERVQHAGAGSLPAAVDQFLPGGGAA